MYCIFSLVFLPVFDKGTMFVIRSWRDGRCSRLLSEFGRSQWSCPTSQTASGRLARSLGSIWSHQGLRRSTISLPGKHELSSRFHFKEQITFTPRGNSWDFLNKLIVIEWNYTNNRNYFHSFEEIQSVTSNFSRLDWKTKTWLTHIRYPQTWRRTQPVMDKLVQARTMSR